MFALMPHQDWLTATVLAFSAQSVTSTSNGNDSKRFIEIVDSKSSLVDKLPTSLTENWPTWVLDETGSFTKIPDTDGFVPPASVDDLFQPLDLKPPQLRIALGIHV